MQIYIQEDCVSKFHVLDLPPPFHHFRLKGCLGDHNGRPHYLLSSESEAEQKNTLAIENNGHYTQTMGLKFELIHGKRMVGKSHTFLGQQLKRFLRYAKIKTGKSQSCYKQFVKCVIISSQLRTRCLKKKSSSRGQDMFFLLDTNSCYMKIILSYKFHIDFEGFEDIEKNIV